MSDMPTGTVTFLFTDLEGSTRQWEEHTEAMEAALERHDAILRKAIAERDGYVFSTAGDAFAAAFDSPSAAVEAALAAQEWLGAEAWQEPVVLRARMGLHTGEAQERDGDYFGPTLNRAARVMSAGHGGQVLISGVTAGLLRRDDLRDLGEHQLKDLSGTERIWQVGSDDFAPLRAADERLGNLPTPPSSFVGRADDVPALAEIVRDAGLVTLTGVGGVGKTRLSIAVAEAAAAAFPDGLWFCELAPVGDPEMVGHAVATALGVPLQQGMTAVESIVDVLKGRRMLVVLDNCEHVLGAAVDLVQAIVAGAGAVTIIASSREPLGVQGENVWAVRSLDPLSEATELFVARARSADLVFEATEEQRTLISDICSRLDGIPLAVELAASRTRSMSVADIDKRLDDRFRLLRGAGRGGLERHQTLRAAVQWSYDLLSDEERALFDRLAVFAGQFDLEAAEAICSDEELVDEFDVVDLLASLVEKSMVQADRSGEVTAFALLETFRQFGEEELIRRGELAERRDRHLRVYTERAADHKANYEGSDWEAGKKGFEFDWDQIRAATGWAASNDDSSGFGDLIRALHVFSIIAARFEVGEWLRRSERRLKWSTPTYGTNAWMLLLQGHSAEAISSALAGIELADDPSGESMSTTWNAIVGAYVGMGDPERGVPAARNARDANRHQPSAFRRATVESITALVAESPEQAAAQHQAAAQIAADLKNAPLRALVLTMAGVHAILESRPEENERLSTDALESARQSGAVLFEAQAMGNLAWSYGELDRPNAESMSREAINRLWEVRDWSNCMVVVEHYGLWLLKHRRTSEATILLAFLAERGYFLHAASPELVDDLRANPSLADSFARGAAMTRDEVVEYALSLTEEGETD